MLTSPAIFLELSVNSVSFHGFQTFNKKEPENICVGEIKFYLKPNLPQGAKSVAKV